MTEPTLTYHPWLDGTKLARKNRAWLNATPTSVEPPASSAARFPGDTNPRLTGKIILGLNEIDQDGYTKHVSELSTPEATAGEPAGCMRYFYNAGNDPFVPPNGAAVRAVTAAHSAGRIPWVSQQLPDWALQRDGRNTAVWMAWIAWIEEVARGKVLFSIGHEPENQTTPRGAQDGTENDWFLMQQAFRACMTAYAASRGGDSYVWKNLAFAPILTAFAFTKGSQAQGIDRYIPTPTDGTFDFIGCDYYIGGQAGALNSPAFGTNIVKTLDWCQQHGHALGIAEFGVNHDDVNAAAKLQEFYDGLLNGSRDVFVVNYYNSSVGKVDPVEQRWMLTGSLLTKWVNLLKDPRTVNMADFPLLVAGETGLLGYPGDSLLVQGVTGGSTAPKDSLVASGWAAENVRTDGATGRGMALDGAVTPTLRQVIDGWRADGFDATTWIIALGSNNLGASDATWANAINEVLDLIASGPRRDYTVYWVGLGLRRSPAPTSASANETTVSRFQAVLDSTAAANTRSNVQLIPVDYSAAIHNGRDETGLWLTEDATGRHMTSEGYAVRNEIITAAVSAA